MAENLENPNQNLWSTREKMQPPVDAAKNVFYPFKSITSVIRSYHDVRHLNIPSLKLTVRTWKQTIPKGNDRILITHFEGRTVSFREGIYWDSYSSISIELPYYALFIARFIVARYCTLTLDCPPCGEAITVGMAKTKHWLHSGTSYQLVDIDKWTKFVSIKQWRFLTKPHKLSFYTPDHIPMRLLRCGFSISRICIGFAFISWSNPLLRLLFRVSIMSQSLAYILLLTIYKSEKTQRIHGTVR